MQGSASAATASVGGAAATVLMNDVMTALGFRKTGIQPGKGSCIVSTLNMCDISDMCT